MVYEHNVSAGYDDIDSYIYEICHVAQRLDRFCHIDETDFEGCGSLSDVKEKLKECISQGYEDNPIYTDADRSCSLLKVDGKVEPYFDRAYKQELSKQQPDQEQSNAAMIINDTVQIFYRQTDSSRVLVIENVSDEQIELKNIQCENQSVYLVLAPNEIYELPENLEIDFSLAECELPDKIIQNNQNLSVSII